MDNRPNEMHPDYCQACCTVHASVDCPKPADNDADKVPFKSHEHLRRTYRALSSAIDANNALRAAVKSFPPVDVSSDEQISPALAVEAFTDILHRRLHAMLALLDGTEPEEGYEGIGHA